MTADENLFGTPGHIMSRRHLLHAAVAGGSALAANAAAAKENPQTVDPYRSASTDWTMMFDLSVRIPPGRFDDWVRFWGGQNIAVLEENGQWLWGAWSSLTGQRDVITHQWAYRDLAHYQAMAAMRMSNPQVQALARLSVPIEENIISSVMTRLPYHPPYNQKGASQPQGDASVIVTNRMFRHGMGNTAGHSALAAEYVAAAGKHGAQLLGAFQSFFGWTPAYVLQVWRYASIERYVATQRAIETDPACRRLLTEMRSLLPNETVDLHRPMPYSRLR